MASSGKDRIVTRVAEVVGEVNGMAEMYVGTIHGFCLDLLKTEVPEFLKYGVLGGIQQVLLVNRHSKQSGLTASTVETIFYGTAFGGTYLRFELYRDGDVIRSYDFNEGKLISASEDVA